MAEQLTPEAFAQAFDIPLDSEEQNAAPKAGDVPSWGDELIQQQLVIGNSMIDASDGTELVVSDESLDTAQSKIRPRRLRKVFGVMTNLFILYGSVVFGDVTYEQFYPASCEEPEADVEYVPATASIADQIRKIDFVENDMERLSKVRSELDKATTLDETKVIAGRYLRSLGVAVHFDQVPSITPNRVYKLPIVNKGYSLASSRYDEARLVDSVHVFLEAVAATPRNMLRGDTALDLYVPDNYTGATESEIGASFAKSPFLPFVPQQRFMIVSLDGITTSENVYWHELGHIQDFKHCAPHEKDERYRSFNPDWFRYARWGELYMPVDLEYRSILEFAVPSEYALQSTTEDKAEVFADVMSNGFSPAESPRGSSPLDDKARLIIGRTIEEADLPELPALIELRRIHGTSRHPLEQISAQEAAFNNDTPSFSDSLELTESSAVPTPFGYINIYCRPLRDAKERYLDKICGVSLRGINPEVLPPKGSTEPWYQNLGIVARIAAEEHMGSANLHEVTTASDYDPNYPHRSIAEFIYTEAN